MKSILCFFAILLTCLGVLAAQPPPRGAKIKENRSGNPTPFLIEVWFGEFVPQPSVNVGVFKVEDTNANAIVTIKSVRRSGIETIDGGVVQIMGVNLDADYNPGHAHKITITFSNKPPIEIPVAPLGQPEKPANGDNQLLNIHYKYLSTVVEPFVADDDKAFGLKYDVRYLLKDKIVGGGMLNIELQTHGEFSITPEKDSTNSIQSSLKGGLDASYLYGLPVDLPVPGGMHSTTYNLGVRVSPAEFEANKSFSDVNYSAKVLIGGAIPYLNYPGLLWNKAFDLKIHYFKPTLFTGFAALSEVKDDGSDTLSKLGHTRWDTEFIYALPLHQRIDFKFVSNWYVGLEKSFWKNNYEIGAVVYLDDQRTHGFTLSRQHGALPPDFIKTESWRIGYTAKF